ncbi:A24 family peptidase [Vibrio alginolyticus]|nr:A24 family peptidase [Vibrio alginolyticus]
MILIIWALLIAIGVSDVQRHRIPNQAVGVLLLAVLLDAYLRTDIVWWVHLKGFLVTFFVCFGFYITRVMAAGDVKLLAVIGLWLGATDMLQVVPFIIVAGGVIAFFYLAHYMAYTTEPLVKQVKTYAVQRATPGWKAQQPLVIPFAPAIVVGLAYYFYIQ